MPPDEIPHVVVGRVDCHLRAYEPGLLGIGQYLVITKTGKELRRQMWSAYGQAIENAVGTKLTPAQAKSLSDILARLIE